ncbi:MAG TPA: transglutaminase domain-containing protein [Candidatus Dojkabacteria bacterium]|nr:transglutaminase domain-containing protein [Candidatus Dojkabacteria bacterium]
MKDWLKNILLSITLLSIPFYSISEVNAQEEDFVIDTNTEVRYTTGDDFATVTTEYIRNVKNSAYYFPASGEKIFHIPDITDSSEDEIKVERKYKLENLIVEDSVGNEINYSIEENDIGEGIYVTVPNYKTTTSNSPYHIVLEYKTHDFVLKIGNFVNIIGPSLPKDTVFEKTDEETGTLTIFNYNFTVVVDENIPTLAKAYPKYTKSEEKGRQYFKFNQTDRIGNSPSLEFGTSVLYKFNLEYTTQQTDNFIPEKYSNLFNALSTNVYEISLPREFAETNQRVYLESISPTPKDIYMDEEGNILALFELPANKDDKIEITGYISVEQDSIEEQSKTFDMSLKDYLEKIKSSDYIGRYLSATEYWEINDEYIKQEAETLIKDQGTLLNVIEANYKYITDKLEYDQNKATSENTRIGAKEALLGGPAVCMEYADVMISLLRAQGIPSRAALGYANLREVAPDNQVRHQWVQVWVPDYGWLSVDPTFESDNMKIGQMVDRVLWEVFNDDSLSNIKIYSANDIVDLTTEGFVVNVFGVTDEVDLEALKTYSDYTPSGKVRESQDPNISSFVGTALKTTTLGKAVLVTLPVFLVLVTLIAIISFISILIKRQKRKRTERNKEKRNSAISV